MPLRRRAVPLGRRARQQRRFAPERLHVIDSPRRRALRTGAECRRSDARPGAGPSGPAGCPRTGAAGAPPPGDAAKTSALNVERREAESRLNAPLHFEQLEVHVDSVTQLGMARLERPKLGDLARLGAARARAGESLDLSQQRIISQARPGSSLVRSSGRDPCTYELIRLWTSMRILMVASEARRSRRPAVWRMSCRRAAARAGAARALRGRRDPPLPGIDAGDRLGQRLPVARRRPGASCRRLHAWRRGGVRTLFVDHPAYFDREHLYGAAATDYPDNPERFAFLSRAALEWVRRQRNPLRRRARARLAGGARAGAPARVRHTRSSLGAPAVFTIHNLAYQGVFDAELAAAAWPGLGADARRRARVLGADQLSERRDRVQPTHHDREPALCRRRFRRRSSASASTASCRHASADLVGILNGIDYDQWDPARDRASARAVRRLPVWKEGGSQAAVLELRAAG